MSVKRASQSSARYIDSGPKGSHVEEGVAQFRDQVRILKDSVFQLEVIADKVDALEKR